MTTSKLTGAKRLLNTLVTLMFVLAPTTLFIAPYVCFLFVVVMMFMSGTLSGYPIAGVMCSILAFTPALAFVFMPRDKHRYLAATTLCREDLAHAVVLASVVLLVLCVLAFALPPAWFYLDMARFNVHSPDKQRIFLELLRLNLWLLLSSVAVSSGILMAALTLLLKFGYTIKRIIAGTLGILVLVAFVSGALRNLFYSVTLTVETSAVVAVAITIVVLFVLWTRWFTRTYAEKDLME